MFQIHTHKRGEEKKGMFSLRHQISVGSQISHRHDDIDGKTSRDQFMITIFLPKKQLATTYKKIKLKIYEKRSTVLLQKSKGTYHIQHSIEMWNYWKFMHNIIHIRLRYSLKIILCYSVATRVTLKRRYFFSTRWDKIVTN